MFFGLVALEGEERHHVVKLFEWIPAGGFVKIVGMTPLEPVDPADSHRAFWRFPLWQRTVVLVAGSVTHFILALVIFYIAGISTGLPNPALQSFDALEAKPVVGQVSPCVCPECSANVTARAAQLRAQQPTMQNDLKPIVP